MLEAPLQRPLREGAASAWRRVELASKSHSPVSHASLQWIGLYLPMTLPVAFQGSTPKAADTKEEEPSGEQSCLSSKPLLLLQAWPIPPSRHCTCCSCAWKAAVTAVQLSYIATAGMETDEQVVAGSAGKEGAEASTSQPAGAHTSPESRHQAGNTPAPSVQQPAFVAKMCPLYGMVAARDSSCIAEAEQVIRSLRFSCHVQKSC